MTIITIEGNIGSGKEEFIDFMKKYFTDDIKYLDESYQDEILLKNFYKNPERWAFTYECFMINEKMKQIIKKDKNTIWILVRSPTSCRDCFGKACFDNNFMDEQEYKVFEGLFANLPYMKNTIYLRTNVNKCYENIITKNKGYEKIISFDYIQKVHNLYEEWVKDKDVLVLDYEEYRNLDGNEKTQEDLLEIILKKFVFLKEHVKIKGHTSPKWEIVKKKKDKMRFSY